MKVDKKKRSEPSFLHSKGNIQKPKEELNIYGGSYEKLPLLILIFTFVFIIACRLRLLGVPLERDEGEYAYAGQQLLHGIPPFVSIYHVKLPGVYIMNAIIIALFGNTQQAIHLGLLFVNLLNIFVVYLLAKKIFNPLNAALSAACFAFLTLSQKTYGFSANAEHFVLLMALPGILFLLRAIDFSSSENRKKAVINFFISSLLLGASYVMKQQAIFFIVFAVLFLIYKLFTHKPFSKANILRSTGAFIIGLILPIGITCLIFLHLGLFSKFWWWTFYYPRIYAAAIPFWVAIYNFSFSFVYMWNAFWTILLLALLGFIVMLSEKDRERKIFVPGLFVFSCMAIAVGFSFYPHYFILVMPAVAMLAVTGANTVARLFRKSKNSFLRNYSATVLILIALTLSIYNERDYLFKLNGMQVARSIYHSNPFPESLKIAEYIERNTAPDDRIAVLGSEPQIYFYAKRRAATGYLYMYELMRDHPYAVQFQEEMIKEIERATPKFIVNVQISSSWFVAPVLKDTTPLVLWANKYLEQHYVLAGVASLPPEEYGETIYCWDAAQIPCKPQSSAWIEIYRKMD